MHKDFSTVNKTECCAHDKTLMIDCTLHSALGAGLHKIRSPLFRPMQQTKKLHASFAILQKSVNYEVNAAHHQCNHVISANLPLNNVFMCVCWHACPLIAVVFFLSQKTSIFICKAIPNLQVTTCGWQTNGKCIPNWLDSKVDLIKH